MLYQWIKVTPLITLFLAFLSHSVWARSIDEQTLDKRKLFKQAETALASKQIKTFKQLTRQLKDYPITPYLEFDELSKRLSRANSTEVRTFLTRYKDYPFVYRLRGRWLHHLAKQKKWQEFLAFYDQRNNTAIKCLSFQARIAQGDKAILKDIEKVWLRGSSQPKECDKPFKYLITQQKDATKLVWQRIEKAFNSGKSSLARYLAKSLNKQDQAIVYQWYLAHKRPEQQLKEALKKLEDTSIHRKIMIHALKRLARRDVVKAHELWKVYRVKFTFNQTQKDSIQQRIALSAAYQHNARAKQWLKALPKHLKTDKTDIWLARINIRDEDWRGLMAAINQMPVHLQQDNEWQYWMARSFAAMGYEAKARSQYKTLAKKGSYYGFLAADKVGLPYRIKNEQVIADINEQQLLKQNIHLLRARELFYVGRTLDARREWFKGVKKLEIKQIKQAAKLASRWQWHDSAIKTVAKTRHRTDYDLRFPMPYKSLVFKNAQLKDLDPSVIYGVMRRESLFDPQAGSGVGALGLMQLMPNTAKQVAKSLGLKRPRRSDILNVENNINLGTQYFKKVLSKFDNNTALAAAAYNAGPHRVKKWLPEEQPMDADLWVETIPFNETRKYVKAVLAYSSIFDKALGQEKKMSSRMQTIKQKY